jgi:hypothetical protein
MQHGEARQSQEDTSSNPSKYEKPCLKDRARLKAKKVLRLEPCPEDEPSRTSHEAAYEELNESPAFNSSKFLNNARIGPSGIPDKVIAIVQGTAEAILHPKAAVKQHATKNAAGKLAKSRPYLSRKADLDFLEAHDELKRVEATDRRGEGCDERRKEEVQGHIEVLERRRQSMRVAWVTARHVQRVRAVKAVPPPPMPEESFFEMQDDCGYTEFNGGNGLDM